MGEHAYDASRKLAKRAGDRDIPIRPCENPKERKKALKDIYRFLPRYFPETFYQPFTSDRRAMADAIIHAARYSGDYGNAGPRGEGKTRLALYCAVWLLLANLRKFIVVVSKNQSRANSELATLKKQFEYNEQFSADFPEVCDPIIALGGWASRARMQTTRGHHTQIMWGADAFRLPSVPQLYLPEDWPKSLKTCALHQSMASVGIEGPIRGMTSGDERPDLAILDDIDDRESAASESQTSARRSIIEQDIAGLGGPGERISRVMLCTVINRRCIAWEYTDAKQKPSWRGKRYRALVKIPDREDLWETFLDLRRHRAEDDPDARKSHNHYLANKVEMNRGGIVANPANFDPSILSDGSKLESSALEHIYNIVADIGWDNFATEYQNDPPADDENEDNAITSATIRSRISGFAHREVPRGTLALTAFLDLGEDRCNFATIAWRQPAIGFVIDHGTITVHNDGQIEKALLAAMWEWCEKFEQEPYRTADGETKTVDMALVDVGAGGLHQSAAYEFCKKAGEPFHPSKGIGATFQHGKNKRGERLVGDWWYRSRQEESKINLYCIGVDYWKRWAQERFRAPAFLENGEFRPGSLSLYELPTDLGRPIQQFAKDRLEYTHQMVAEIWTRKVVPGKPIKEEWARRSRQNHFLDATAGACAAGSMCGIRLLGERKVSEPQSLADVMSGR